MSTYCVSGINVGSFNLGEADKILTIFTAERGLIRAVAKGARKPSSKITGKAEVLNVNKLFLAKGRSLDIITQAESIETFTPIRQDLARLSYALYYAELTQAFGQGVGEDSLQYFDLLCVAMNAIAESAQTSEDPTQLPQLAWLALRFELRLLDLLGYQPELAYCVTCRTILNDLNLACFDKELGGIICQNCHHQHRQMLIAEGGTSLEEKTGVNLGSLSQITPMVWKHLVLANQENASVTFLEMPVKQSMLAAKRLIQGYLEHRAGRRFKSLDLIVSLK
jgi:DNA repair protein RecO (recombination protein O)